MADVNGQEKTEQPTGKRRNDARREGNVFQSRDIPTVVMLFGVFCMMRVMIPYIYRSVREYMVWMLDGLGGDLASFFSLRMAILSVFTFLKCALPLLLTSVVLGILSHGVQTRFNVSFHSIRPKFSKLNPITGIKRLFSLKKIVDLVKNLIKVSILLAVLYNLVRDDVSATASMLDMYPLNSTIYMMQMVYSMVLRICLAFTVVAFFDYLYQRWNYEKDLKMTKQEVKEEFKNTEGNPEIKGRIRQVQRQMAMSRMMQKVPQADVIIRNPTHYAVALKYDPKKNRAPMVLAKGQDELALRIIRVGEQHGVYIIENRPLARALYASCELDHEIPVEYYGAVAEILVYIYKASHREDMFD